MSSTIIHEVHAREMIDCRGYPTLEVDVRLEGDGLIDGETTARVESAGLEAQECLRAHSALEALKASGDLVITDHTGTNVNDLKLLLLGSGLLWEDYGNALAC